MWVSVSAVVGLVGALLPDRVLGHETAITRIRPVERDGRLYARLRIKRWKRRLPETNNFGPGARPSKSSLGGRDGIAPLVSETRRAEYVHLCIAACGPLFLLWNPPALGTVMVAFGVAFNAPFIVVQRYNRARLLAVLRRPLRSVSR